MRDCSLLKPRRGRRVSRPVGRLLVQSGLLGLSTIKITRVIWGFVRIPMTRAIRDMGDIEVQFLYAIKTQCHIYIHAYKTCTHRSHVVARASLLLGAMYSIMWRLQARSPRDRFAFYSTYDATRVSSHAYTPMFRSRFGSR